MTSEPALTRAERNKIEGTLLLWFDGQGTAEALELPTPPGGSRGRVRVSVQLSRDAIEPDRELLTPLGVEFAAGEQVLFAVVSREMLAALARLTGVTFIQPVQVKSTKRPL